MNVRQTRRKFIQLLTGGAIGLAVAAKVPWEWLPEKPRDIWAIKYLTKRYNEFVKEHKTAPSMIMVSGELFDAYMAQLVIHQRFVQRFVEYPLQDQLLFKGCSLQVNPKFKGLDLAIGGTIRKEPTSAEWGANYHYQNRTTPRVQRSRRRSPLASDSHLSSL